MGQKMPCNTSFCFNQGKYRCRCDCQTYCMECLSLHLSDKAVHYMEYVLQSRDNTYWQSKLVYLEVIYSTQDGSTEVFLTKNVDTGEKLILKSQHIKNTNILMKRVNEARTQQNLSHNHLCKAYASFTETDDGVKRHCIVMEYGKNDLEKLIYKLQQRFKYLNEDYLVKQMIGLIDALQYMQTLNVTHRDIKPGNIIQVGKNFKLADFGVCLQGDQLIKTQEYRLAGTPIYLSPELRQQMSTGWSRFQNYGMVNHNPYKSDVFSLGLTFYNLASLERPIDLNFAHSKSVLQEKIDKAIKKLKYGKFVKDLISQMLQVENRMDFIQLIRWVKEQQANQTPPKLTKVKQKKRFHRSQALEFEKNDGFLQIGNQTISIQYSNHLPSFQAQQLQEALKLQQNLKELNLDGCQMQMQGIRYISNALKYLTQLQLLSLMSNQIDQQAARILSKGLTCLKILKKLNLGYNQLQNAGIIYIGSSIIHLQLLTHLELNHNQITKEGIQYLLGYLPISIKKLNLSDNSIGQQGAFLVKQHFESSPKQVILQMANIGQNTTQDRDS